MMSWFLWWFAKRKAAGLATLRKKISGSSIKDN